ncbi:MAG: gamma-glutamyltransferase [Desulfobulbaceae bacterium]|uniref:Gamma-glutamyltransferase n=1 Tax=Candidatus Desulfobia pelagia TaxID=2841692 RepID=A0A8J6NED6_9BACT|nr:gamma-glutamyltransferase [Candidatus Desulfobia pelagia]
MTPHKAIVASGDPLVSDTAIQIIRQGGNAYDGIIAAGFVSAIAEPTLTSLGGGGFLMARTSEGTTKLFDFFTNTPGQGLPASDLQPHFYPITIKFANSDQDFNIGLGSVAVPGTLKGFLHVHKRLGVLPLKEILAPAIHYAKNGVLLSENQSTFLQLLEPIMTMTDTGREHYSPGGHYFKHGETLTNHDLACFLEKLASNEEHSFYQGELASRIEQDMLHGQGLLTAADLKDYQVYERDPITTQYRGKQFITNPPPSFGGSLITHALQGLEHFDFSSCAPLSPEYVHAHAAVMQHIENGRQNWGMDTSIPPKKFSRGTTHISVSDGSGNVASMTCSNGEGSGYFIPGTGIMLNNMMGEDDLHPNGFHSEPPGQRVSSMMSPSLLLEGDNIVMVIGSGGSKRIRTAITQVLSLVVDFGMNLQEAVNAPRIHWDEKMFQVEPGFTEDSLNALRELGEIKISPMKNVYFGGVHAVIPKQEGGADPRRGGAVKSFSLPECSESQSR